MPDFKVVSEYEPAGDQPQAIDKLAQGLENGLRAQVLKGVTGSGKTYTMAKVIERVNRPTLVLAHNKTLAAQLCEEFREFFPNNAVEYFVSYYDYYQPEAYIPHTDTYIEKDASTNEEIDRLRLSATCALLERRDGLMLGICNGFQALIKLGLVPFGKIVEMEQDSPTLTFNTIARHQSMLVTTRVASTKSPWLYGCEVGDLHTVAISHGEGRFVAPPALIEQLAENGQIATQYVDLDGNPTMDIHYNPNTSMMAIEGITSPDGRVFGKMGHSERIGTNLYRNVPGEKDQKIFQSGVAYFR